MSKHLFHLMGYVKILSQYDALPLTTVKRLPLPLRSYYKLYRRQDDRAVGEKLADAFEKMGPTFIKLGQMLSTRPDLVGQDVAHGLLTLQDHLPPFDSKLAHKLLAASLGRPLTQIFKSIDKTPVAAASIAQVYQAKLLNNKKVAVKILRPNIREIFARDIAAFKWLARLLNRRQKIRQVYKPLEVIGQFEVWISRELDLKLEAANADRLRQNFATNPDFEVPKVYWELCRSNVLVLDWVDGCRIDDVKTIKSYGIKPHDVLQKSATILFYQVFRDGYFHADIHPGNMFVTKAGKLAPVDFGIMGSLDDETRLYLGEILAAFLTRNYTRVAEVHIQAGLVSEDSDVEYFATVCRAIGEPLLDKPINKIYVGPLLESLFIVARQFGMVVQPHLLLLQKTIIMAEGTGRILDPNTNMWVMLKPLMEKWARRELGPEAKLKAKLSKISEIIDKLPLAIDRYLEPKTVIIKVDDRRWRRMLKLALLFAVGVATGIGAYYFYVQG